MKKEMDQLARKAESLEGSNSKLASKLEVQREELTNRVQQAQFEAAQVRLDPVFPVATSPHSIAHDAMPCVTQNLRNEHLHS